MREMEIHDYARQLLETHGLAAIAKAVSRVTVVSVLAATTARATRAAATKCRAGASHGA